MRKLLMLAVAVAFGAILVGCSGLPQNLDLTGKWSYNYGPGQKTGTLTLSQDAHKLTGTANDAEGQFTVTGTVNGPVLALTCTCAKPKLTKIINATIETPNEFKGSYTSTDGKSGKISGKRQ